LKPPDEKELLFRRLEEAAGKHPCRPVPPRTEPLPASAGETDRIALFGKMLARAGGTLFPGPVESVLHDLGEALRAEGVTALFAPEGDDAARRAAEALAPFGPFTLTTCLEVRQGSQAVTAGFRSAEVGIAETGTIVETSAEGKTLLPGLLADVHVSLLPAASLRERLDEALSSFRADPPRSVSLCTGPGRPADNGPSRVAGAHGPRKTIVLLT